MVRSYLNGDVEYSLCAHSQGLVEANVANLVDLEVYIYHELDLLGDSAYVT